VHSAEKGIFRKAGEFWTVGYGGKSLLLKDTKGFGYLAHLLRHPGTEFHVLDLVSGIAAAHEELDAMCAAVPYERFQDTKSIAEKEARAFGDEPFDTKRF
jgi:hypothetical protein